MKTPITVAHGDGIGPEIMKATLAILEKAGAEIDIEEIEIGEKVYLSGNTAGIRPESWDSLRRTKVFLKAPITTPFGGGYKSLNVTVRKSMGLFANVRPCRSYHPFVRTKHPVFDCVIVRENEEDTYAGIEHQQTADVVQCLKLITRPGCEKIVRYAFEYAKQNGRKKVTAMVKDNIMKHTDGLFREVFEEIAKEYSDIEKEVMIIDIGSAMLADRPENFDVVVTLNLYGDIISDIVAQISGSVGVGGSANIGESLAMFEAVHGSAPDIAGQDLANPSGLLSAAVMMLVHIGQPEVANKIQNAWLKTLEDGIHTGDIYDEKISKKKASTSEFADAIIKRLGELPAKLTPADFKVTEPVKIPAYKRPSVKKQLVGVDVFIDSADIRPDDLGNSLEAACPAEMKLKMITNRGVKVYPDGLPDTFCTDHWRCRFVSKDASVAGDTKKYAAVERKDLLNLLNSLYEKGFDTIKTENLYYFDGNRAFSLGQGE